MSKNKIIITSLIVATFVVTLSGCYKTTTLLEDNTPAVTTTVSFSKDIVPLLTANCAKSGCHGGTINPNLTAANAYNSLTGGLVNTATPSNSVVFLWLTGKDMPSQTYMPLGGTNNPGNINGLILAWITQGAKNN